MKEKERRLYTKYCLELLGYKCISPSNKTFKFYTGNSSNLPPVIEANFSRCFIKNWNCIMAIVEAIENLDFSKDGYSWELDGEIQYNNEGISVDIENNWCIIYQNLALDPMHIYSSVKAPTKKEAVVKAINEFLILYNETKIT